MKNIKMASPLYILREECARDLAGVLKKLADVGFDALLRGNRDYAKKYAPAILCL